jgi:hypothetical protein
MQTQDFAPAASGTRTILLGRNRLSALAASSSPVVKSFESRAGAPVPSLSARKAPAKAAVSGRFDLPQHRD